MIDLYQYFSEDKTGCPYQDLEENNRDYMSLVWGITDMAIRWREECEEEECIPARGIRTSQDQQKSILALKNTPPEDRGEEVLVPDIQKLVREGLEYISAREEATPKQKIGFLHIKTVKEAFHLTERQFVLFLLLWAARGDLHILEAFSYIAADDSILETGAVTVGLWDMLLHLIFKYEPAQADVLTDTGSTFSRCLADLSHEGKSPFQNRSKIGREVYRYTLLGEGALSKKPERSTPGTALYFEEFAKLLSRYEESKKGRGQETGFCYIRTKDTSDVVHVLTKLFEGQAKPLYVLDSGELKANNKKLLFTLRLMHYLQDAGILIRFRIDETKAEKNTEEIAKEMTAAIRDAASLLSGMGTIYLTGTVHLPELEVHGTNTPAVFTLPAPDVNMRYAMWQDLFHHSSLTLGDGLDLMDLADCNELSFGQIRTVVERCAANVRMSAAGDGVVKREVLQEILFTLSAVDFEHLATQVEARYTWDDIFLEESQKRLLKFACDRFRLRNRIGAQWEITKKNAYGNAVIILLYGPPGTGKTMAAQVVANEVMTPLYRVDVSQIFSKYICETRKNLSQIFEEAQKRNVVLFFDEADALFTRRTEVKDSHDKYTNSDTSFLLQKVEEYKGISILATNNYQNFDPAFRRRLTYAICFDLPDETTRKHMWHTMLSDRVPLAADVDLDWLAAKFNDFSGSNIKSTIMTACFMAASEEKPLSMRHLVKAVSMEYQKIGRLVDMGTFEQYSGYLLD